MMQLERIMAYHIHTISRGRRMNIAFFLGIYSIFCTHVTQVLCQHNGNYIMYPSINRQGLLGNFLGGRSPISYGPSPTGRTGTPGQIPGYDLRGGVDILGSFRKAKSSILHGAGHLFRFKGDAYNSFANAIDGVADGVDPRGRPSIPRPSNAVAPPPPPPAPDVVLPLRTPTRLQTPAGRAPNQFTRLQEQFRQQQAQKLQQNFQLNQLQQKQQQFQRQKSNRFLQFNQQQQQQQQLNQQQQFRQPQNNFFNSQLQTQASFQSPRAAGLITNGGTCDDRLGQLVGDIFIGHEMIPQVLDFPPEHPLELTYRTIRTYPGMRVTTDATRFNPMMHWPAEPGAYYTIIISNLDINSRKNRSLAEFWHWFVANIPGNSVGEGEEIFQLLHPLVLPEGNGGHRYGYFVFKQPNGLMDYSDEGGPTDNCSPNMSVGRGPYRSTKDFMKKYGLKLTASTFLIVDTSPASIEIACEWQACMGGQVFLRDLTCANAAQNIVTTVRKKK